MFGDFEAQRHWLEITVNTPVGEWYTNTSNNDLLYWGLDYPPLTAYVSYVYGKLAQIVYPDLVALRESRGHDTEFGKFFMRMSVLVLDIAIFFPAIQKFVGLLHHKGLSIEGDSKRPNKLASLPLDIKTLIALVSPAIILIDHGHFQYNCVCIGLAILGLRAIIRGKHLLGSFLFCLSLNFKQMALYYAPVFFFALLRKSYESYRSGGIYGGILKLSMIGLVVILTFLILWLPFCLFPSTGASCTSSSLQVLRRLFTFSRGIFEDKVANIWYSLSVVIDFRYILEMHQLVRLSTLLTLVLLSPVSFDLLWNSLTAERAALALVNSSLAFFLASFQVHEKSLLLVLVPASTLFVNEPIVVSWFQLLGVFSMFPLLKKDGLTVPYILISVVFICLVLLSKETVLEADSGCEIAVKKNKDGIFKLLTKYFIVFSSIGMFVLQIGYWLVTPPQRYPDLFPALFALFSACNLCMSYLYFISWQLTLNEYKISLKFSSGDYDDKED